MTVPASPFHSRTAQANLTNAWAVRAGMTVACSYAGAADEALAARFRVGLIDISWRWRVLIEGARAEDFASKFASLDAQALAPGQAAKALWLNDSGGVRGAGVFARHGREAIALIAANNDGDWLARAAARFDVAIRPLPQNDGGLALTGPYASAVLSRAGIDAGLAPLSFRKLFWRGFEITLSRFGEQNGFELWCGADEAYLLWDRLMRAGEAFGIVPVGLDAADVLDLEAGIARPGRDYLPAETEGAPSPPGLGLESLIAPGNRDFNGYAAYAAMRPHEKRCLAGIVIASAVAAPFTPLSHQGKSVGHTLSSVYSPALQHAIALAQIDTAVAAPGTALSLTLPPSIDAPLLRAAEATVAELPFLPPPEQMG